jgi:DNA-binding beta-propeller fold protein YncE
MSHRPVSRSALRPLLLLSPLALLAMGANFQCGLGDLPRSGAQLYLSPQVQPMALSEDGTLLYVANTTSGTLTMLDVMNPLAPRLYAEIRVGHDPVAVAVLPGGVGYDELVFVVNHISDSISVVSRNRFSVVQTIQAFDANGVTRMDEPTGIAFTGPDRALVTLDQPNQVLVLDIDAGGRATIAPERVAITAQAPRAIAVAGGRAFVASFESGNQTEFSSCWTGDTRGLLENDDELTDEGCEFETEILDARNPGSLTLGSIFQFAAVNPNIGGRVVRDTDIPDRDLFVIDPSGTPSVVQVLGTIGTLLAGIAAHDGPAGTRLWVSHTEARNHLDGLAALDNRMFENRVAVVDCAPGGSCSLTGTVDLDASAAAIGRTVPNPWGIQASADGQTVVVTAASADGDPGDGRPPLPGLFTLDRDGNVLGAAVVGALPEGVVLRSAPGGEAHVAYVLNTADSTVSVVDVTNQQSPQTVGPPITVGKDPTPAQIRLGRIAFHSARGSTSRTFACGSCHPNGNIDQLQWTINTVTGPDDGADAKGEIAEPRTTMPIRGLRDTLPLHWEGTLADPFPGVNPEAVPFDSAPDCDLEVDGEIGCVRHLVDAALSGPNCQHNVPGGCQPEEGQTGPGGSNLPGSLTDEERDAMAAFQLAVAFPPAPDRRPDDVLSPLALGGVADFFTNEDGEGINDGIGQVLGFAPTTCADNPMGCHSLPLTHSTNSDIVGGFDAPGARGMWDRFTLFSNGIFSSEEVLRGTQDCADGIAPPAKTIVVAGFQVNVAGDPCNIQAPLLSQLFGFSFADLPFPSGEQIYDPSVGMTERGSFIATFEGIFSLVYGVRGDRIWQYQMEIGTGLPGLTGRQVSIDPSDPDAADTVAWMDRIEAYAQEGRVTGVAVGGPVLGQMRWDPALGAWAYPSGWTRTGAQLRALAGERNEVITITADLPANISIGGADRQPLLDVDPDARAAEVTGDQPTLPRPFENESATFRLGAEYVDPAAAVLVNGVRCERCSIAPAVAPGTGKNALDVTLDPGLPRGVHVVQVLNPSGWASNEMPICVTNVELGRPLPGVEEEACKPGNLQESVLASAVCPTGQVVTSCSCQPGTAGAVRSCAPNPAGRACNMTLYCFEGACVDAVVAPTCGAP